MLCCASNILLSAFGACNKVDDIFGGAGKRVTYSVDGAVAGVGRFEGGVANEVKVAGSTARMMTGRDSGSFGVEIWEGCTLFMFCS